MEFFTAKNEGILCELFYHPCIHSKGEEGGCYIYAKPIARQWTVGVSYEAQS